MEMVVALPILMFVIMAGLEFSLLFLARGQLAEASRIGARRAMLAGVAEEDVETEVRRVLSPALQHGLKISVELGDRSGDMVQVALAVPMTSAAPDLLWPIGISINQQAMVSETRMVRE